MGKASNRKSIRIVSIMKNNKCTDSEARKIFQVGKKRKRLFELKRKGGTVITKTEGERGQFTNFKTSLVKFTPANQYGK